MAEDHTKPTAPNVHSELLHHHHHDEVDVSEKWRCVGEAESMQAFTCQHIFSESGKDDDLVLIYTKEKFHAMLAWCGHQGGPLYEGEIEETPKGHCRLVCPWHGYSFDVDDGKNELGLVQPVFETKIEDGKVYVMYKAELSVHPFPEWAHTMHVNTKE